MKLHSARNPFDPNFIITVKDTSMTKASAIL